MGGENNPHHTPKKRQKGVHKVKLLLSCCVFSLELYDAIEQSKLRGGLPNLKTRIYFLSSFGKRKLSFKERFQPRESSLLL